MLMDSSNPKPTLTTRQGKTPLTYEQTLFLLKENEKTGDGGGENEYESGK